MVSPLPKRTAELFKAAETLYREHFYVPSLLMYCSFLEQVLLVKYIRESDPKSAKMKMDKIIKIKDSGKLTFGNILELVKPLLEPEIYNDCKKIKKIRDTTVAHSFFVMPIDPKNKHRLAFYDVSNYRKIIRRLYNLIKNEENLDRHDHKIVLYFLNYGDPAARMRNLEEDADYTESCLLMNICITVKELVEKIMNQLYIPSDYHLAGYTNLPTWLKKQEK